MSPGRRAGLRVLVVEDEFLLACTLEEDLVSFGFAVVGPFPECGKPNMPQAERRWTWRFSTSISEARWCTLLPSA